VTSKVLFEGEPEFHGKRKKKEGWTTMSKFKQAERKRGNPSTLIQEGKNF